jgi:hypothetical protein
MQTVMKQSLLIAGLIAGAALSTAQAATITVLPFAGSTCSFGTADGVADVTVAGNCANDGFAPLDDWGGASNDGGPAVSSNIVGSGSASAVLRINAAVAADDGGADFGQGNDRWVRQHVAYALTLLVDVDSPTDSWTVDLGQAALGLFAFMGDGLSSAVGNQDDGVGRVLTIQTTVDGNPYNFAVVPGSTFLDASNTNSASQAFSGSRNDVGLLAGVGDAIVNAAIQFDLEALSNDGCSGFGCSSASGGEEAAVLFGLDNVMADGTAFPSDETVDNYATWGRSVDPDGLDMTFTLNVTATPIVQAPEPGTLALLGAGLAALPLWRRRRR